MIAAKGDNSGIGRRWCEVPMVNRVPFTVGTYTQTKSIRISGAPALGCRKTLTLEFGVIDWMTGSLHVGP